MSRVWRSVPLSPMSLASTSGRTLSGALHSVSSVASRHLVAASAVAIGATGAVELAKEDDVLATLVLRSPC